MREGMGKKGWVLERRSEEAEMGDGRRGVERRRGGGGVGKGE